MSNSVDVRQVSMVERDGYVIPRGSRASTRKLLAVDRCDSKQCNAAARVRAVKNSSELLFCGHHARRNVNSLVDSGWLIDDQSVDA